MTDFDKKMILAAIAVVGGYIIYKKFSGVAGQVVQSINPLNDANIINQGAQSVYQNVTGSKGSPGGDLYEMLNPCQAASIANDYQGPSWFCKMIGYPEKTIRTMPRALPVQSITQPINNPDEQALY